MLKAGLLPSPIITPLSSSPLALKNKIDTQTFVEIRSDIPDVRIYFTVDGSKPDPFQIFRTGSITSFLYRGAFRLGTGKRVVKAIAVTNNGLRESNVVTKYLDVDDKYSDNYDDSLNEEYSDHDQNDTYQARNEFDRSAWEHAFSTQGTIEGPMSSVRYADLQGNATNTFEDYWIDPNKSSQHGYIKEQIVERLPPPAPVRVQPAPQPRILDTSYEEEKFWDRKTKPLSPGNGNWKKTLEHLFLNIYNYVKDERELRELFGWKIFGRMETIRLIDKGKVYQILGTFKKPLGEQSYYEEPPLPIRKHSSKHRSKKRIRTPPDTDEENSTQRTYSPKSPVRRPEPKRVEVKQQEEEEDDDEQTLRIYTEEIVQQGTLVPYENFDVDRDCEHLRKAIQSHGTNDDALIQILGNRSADQRVKIRDRYKVKFERDLARDLKTDASENLSKIRESLLYSRVEYDCRELQRAIQGFGTDEEALIEILASRTNKRLEKIHDLYPKLFNRSLEEDINSDTSGYFKKLLLVLSKGQRLESNEINEYEVKKDAKALYQAGENKWGTDESKFIQILCNRSDVQLKAIFEEYKKFSKRDIEDDIKSETSGRLCDGLLAIVRLMRNRPGFFVHQLEKALKTVGTNDNELNRVIISRCELDMIQIKEEYERLMKRSLEDHIQSSVSGSYRRILLELIKDPNERIEKSIKTKYDNADQSDHEPSEGYNEDDMHQGTIVAAKDFDAVRDANALQKAMKGMGTDEKTLIGILGNRNTIQRLEIKSAFKVKFNRDLTATLKSETSGNFCKLLENLMLDPVELDCVELKQAVIGAGTDEEALIEILASRSNERIRSINEKYTKMYSRSLEKDLKSDMSGDFRRLLVSLLQGRRPESSRVNSNQVKQDAKSLVDAGSKRFATDDSKFNDLLCNRSDSQLKAIFDEYNKLTGKSIEETVKKETSGDLRNGILATIRCIQSRPQFFAEQLNKAIKGSGTKESTVNRIILTRAEIDLLQIKAAYKKLFNRELERDISGDTSGDYKKLLLEILKDPSERS